MDPQDPTNQITAVYIDRADVRVAQLQLHMRTTDAYRTAVARNHATETSVLSNGEKWHRWAEWTSSCGVQYVAHDPERYDTDPLSAQKRVRELHEMLSAVLNATDMTPAEKATEVARLSERITALLTAEVRDDIATISEAALRKAEP